MSPAREGQALLALTAATAATLLAGAVWRRSWTTWLVGFGVLVLALVVAWTCRTVTPDRPARPAAVVAPAALPEGRR